MRIAFYLRHPFHQAIFAPLVRLLEQDHHCFVSRNEVPALINFRPQVVISGEDIAKLRLRSYLPGAIFIHTRHGLASKGIAYRSASATDYLCVTSSHMRDWYLTAGAQPRRDFWLTGYLQMDGLFRAIRGESARPISPALGLPEDPAQKIVLYAPTFQGSLSSAPLLGDRVVDCLLGQTPDAVLLIKPHPLVRSYFPQWLTWWQEAALRHANVHLAPDLDADVMPYLAAADLLVTDASSVALIYLATNRPMVLITSPHRFDEPYFDANGLEWRWRDMGTEIHNLDRLPAAVAEGLAHPDQNGEQRRRYRRLLFDDLDDGRAAERIADRVQGLAAQARSERRLWPAYVAGRAVWKAAELKRQVMRRRDVEVGRTVGE